MKTTRRMFAAAVVGALVLTACGDAPEEETPDAVEEPEATDEETEGDPAEEEPTEEPAEQTDFRGCLVTDQGGVDDQSFNQTAWEGMVRAEQELGITADVLESTSEADFEPNIQEFVTQGCDLIVTVGFLLGEATEAAAQANPDQNFAIVDYAYDADYDNLRELVFGTEEAAFLAGYAAAGTTESGIVGTYGGINIPPVTVFMDGFLAGVRYYNQENGTDVQVEGWDGSDGLFTGNFESQDDGRNFTDQLLQAGADIIMPVAGPVGLGTAAAIEDFGSGMIVWVDTDGYESTQYGALMLTSVMKNMDVAVFDSVQAAVDGNWEGGLVVGTLENEGVGLAPFHDFEDTVPQEVRDALDGLRQGIISGEISVDPADYS
ncbi:MAG: BMP family ABC transporter substrate-binding protein [Actinobacteria bacterium]|jgi:basic membrane protein A|nr:BMP family ABC transporter substrate-binding protein [Actinomycetota bacterium]